MQASRLDDNDILEYLKKYFEIESSENLEAWGIFNIGTNHQTDKNFYTIKNIKTKNKLAIEYPIIDLEEKQKVRNNGIYIPFAIGEELVKSLEPNKELFVSCNLILSEKHIRKQNDNPMLLQVDSKSIEILKQIPRKIEILDDIDNLYIEENTFNMINELHNIDELLIQKEKEVSDEKLKLEAKQITLSSELKELENNHDEKIQTLHNKELKKQKSLDKLEENTKFITKEIKDKKSELSGLTIKVQEIQKILKNEEDTMAKKLEKLRAYIKDKADTLLNLEFIDQEEYNNLLMINQNAKLNEKFVDFENDLHSDKQQAVSHIQAYLFEQDIVYPRYILEDFFALVQTNDLIILAGESGSGKTNLIKSFAQAIGGKSFIIPVKPNWTSSEDLLGYYNPLEKKYLTTHFLEALLEAIDNPDIPYFICLDEMNLARVEYYFADFLSLLEERGEQPEIKLYSEDESAHILSEFNMVLSLIESTKEKLGKNNIKDYIGILEDTEINQELKRVFGFSDKDSLIKYHSDLKRMLSGILSTPSSIIFPKNVRIIGAINIDETTHYLSPKILDRAHIMKFESPLLNDWGEIAKEIEDFENKDLKIKINIENLGTRELYPSFDRNDEFCKAITNMTKEYFSPLGVEVGLRTIRQGLNYQKIFSEQGSDKELVMNNFIIHKILPKMTFDGKKKVGEIAKNDLLLQFKENLKDYIDQNLAKSQSIDAITEIEKIIKISENNEGIVNYWA